MSRNAGASKKNLQRHEVRMKSFSSVVCYRVKNFQPLMDTDFHLLLLVHISVHQWLKNALTFDL